MDDEFCIFKKKSDLKVKARAADKFWLLIFYFMTSRKGAVAVEKEGDGRHTPQTNIGAQSSKLKKKWETFRVFQVFIRCLVSSWVVLVRYHNK